LLVFTKTGGIVLFIDREFFAIGGTSFSVDWGMDDHYLYLHRVMALTIALYVYSRHALDYENHHYW
jgi:hypothetical protein